MKYTVVSDIHANLPALQAVLSERPQEEPLICLGDIIGLGGFPIVTVKLLQKKSEICLQGNHDLSVIEWGEGHVNDKELSMFELEHTISSLNMSEQEWISSLSTYHADRDKGLLCAHANPEPENSSGFYGETKGVMPSDFVSAGANVSDWVETVMLGHTHRQHVVDCREFDGDHGVTVMNPGAVGVPVDSGSAEYAVYDTEEEPGSRVSLQSASYDAESLTRALNRMGVPFGWWKDRSAGGQTNAVGRR